MLTVIEKIKNKATIILIIEQNKIKAQEFEQLQLKKKIPPM